MKKWILLLIPIALLVFFLGRLTAPRNGEAEEREAAVQLYTCGMHPEVIQEGPGDCPICDMHLTPMQAPVAGKAGTKALYTCPMHPEVLQEGPGDCPICHMHLVPAKAPGSDEGSSGEIRIDPAVVQNIGVTTAPVTRGTFRRTVRTYGTLDWDETTLAKVNTKMEGWIDALYVDETGQRVRRGQPLLALYSPDLVASQEEYLAAARASRKLSGSAHEGVSAGGRELLAAARRRLELWDISEKQIADLEETGTVRRTLTLYAPAGGVVVRKDVVTGDHVMPGTDLMEVASSERLWLMASLYEQDIPLVREGMKADAAFDILPGERFEAEVDYVYPSLEGSRRTAEARLIVPNPTGLLRPGMYATVRLSVPVDEDALQIPADAVIRPSSERAVAFVSRGDGRFAGRELVLGPEGDGGMVLVKAGLEEGERVVTSAQFLLDSESRLQEAVQAMLDREKTAPAQEKNQEVHHRDHRDG